MATVQKGSKINFYQFVNPEVGGSVAGSAAATDNERNLSSQMVTQTRGLNNLGSTINSIASVVVDIKKINYARLSELEKKKVKFDPKYTKPKNFVFDFLKKVSNFKAPNFLENLLKMLGNLLKLLLIPVLKWIADPKNQKLVKAGIETIHGIFKGIMAWAKFSTNSILNGLYDMLKEDATWQERLVGFGKFLVGFGSILIGLRWLSNPLVILGDLKKTLTLFKTGIIAAKVRITAMTLGPLGFLFLAGGASALAAWWMSKRNTEQREEDNEKNDDDYVTPGEFNESRQDDDKSNDETPSWAQLLLEMIGQQGAGGMFAKGGYIKGYANGGWIHGPQSGYPVSLDGKGTDFIGHGTEYVARDAGGQAFVIPFDTSATRKDSGLTSRRISEARDGGFKLGYQQGGFVPFAKQLIKIHEGSNVVGGKHVPYRDSQGHQTIGYGHLIKPGDNFGGSISKARANRLFDKDFNQHLEYAKSAPGWENATAQQKAALVDLTFNMGAGWWNQFPLFSEAMEAGNYERAGRELKDSLYYQQVGRRAPTIIDLINNRGIDRRGYLRGIKMPGGGFHSRRSSPIKETLLEGMMAAMTHPDTGSGWGISGQNDKSGRPVVLSQPAAKAFASMLKDSNGNVRGSDVASSGRSVQKNRSLPGADANSHHLYGEALDVDGQTAVWMRRFGKKYGWEYVYSHGPGSAHFKYVGPGAGVTPRLGTHGSQPVSKSDTAGSMFNSIYNTGTAKKGQTSLGGGRGSFSGGGGMGKSNLADVFAGGKGGSATPRRYGASASSRYEEQNKLKAITEQRNQARREINSRSQAMVQAAIEAVTASNGSAAQIVKTARAAIAGMSGGGGGGSISFNPGGGSFGNFARTAVGVLNSFNNPLQGVFRA